MGLSRGPRARPQARLRLAERHFGACLAGSECGCTPSSRVSPTTPGTTPTMLDTTPTMLGTTPLPLPHNLTAPVFPAQLIECAVQGQDPTPRYQPPEVPTSLGTNPRGLGPC